MLIWASAAAFVYAERRGEPERKAVFPFVRFETVGHSHRSATPCKKYSAIFAIFRFAF